MFANQLPFHCVGYNFPTLCPPCERVTSRFQYLKKKLNVVGKGFYQVSYLRVHEGTLQACCHQASEFSFEDGLRHLLPSGGPAG